MVLTHRLRKAISKYSYLETAILMMGLLFLGYLIDPSDPALVRYEIFYIIILLAIVTMFHGISNGLFAVFIIALAMKYFYLEFPIDIFLKLFILVLVFGEFHYFWNRKILHNSSKNTYLSMKLDELSKAFYTLKISHDQLEKNYVFKPMSVRNSIRELKEAYVKNQNYYGNFLLLLKKSFNVSEAEFCSVFKDKLYSVYDETHQNEIDKKDPMIEMALRKKTPVYVSSDSVENNSAYLAVVPVVSGTQVKAILLIKDMPFMSFNKDNLISISIIIAYFLDEREKWKLVEEATNKPIVDDEFYFELQRLKGIYDEFDVNSTILILKTKDTLLAHLILEKIKENLRSLDLVSTHSFDDIEALGILFPFADHSSAQGFLTRLLKLLKLKLEDTDIEHSFFDIAELEIVKEYAGVANDTL